MKKTLITLICATVAIAATTPMASARVKKNDPDKKEVLKELEELAVEHPDHYVRKMRIFDTFTLDYEDDEGEDVFFHFYCADLKKLGYRIIIYDNTPTYLGYYPVTMEPVGYEEGTFMVDMEETSDDGGDTYARIPFPIKGPPRKVKITPTYTITFVSNPALEKKAAAVAETGGIPVVPKEVSESGEVIDYRDWTINMGGKEVIVNAIFVRLEKGKVVIKSAKSGKEATIPGSALSDADKEYVKRITAK